MRISTIYRSIPVYPEFISDREISRQYGHKVEFPTEMPLCEETRKGRVFYAFVSTPAKRRWLEGQG